MGGGGELTGGRVDAENAEGVGILVRAEEPGAVGREGEVARDRAAGGDVFDEGEFAGGGVAGEDREAVVAAVGGVDKAVVGMDPDFGARFRAVVIGGEGGEGLDRREGAGGSVVAEGAERRVELVEDVEMFSVAGELAVARTGAGRDGGVAGFVAGEGAGGGIEGKREDAVEAEIGDVGEAVVGRKRDGVRVGFFLAVGARAERAFVLDQRRARLEFAVGCEWKGGGVAAAVAGNEDEAGVAVDGEVGDAAGAGGFGVEAGELASGAIESEGGHATARIGFIDRVEDRPGGVEIEERRIAGFGGELGGGEFAGCSVDVDTIDAFAFAAGVGAEVDEMVGGGGEGGEGEGEREGEEALGAHGGDRADCDGRPF